MLLARSGTLKDTIDRLASLIPAAVFSFLAFRSCGSAAVPGGGVPGASASLSAAAEAAAGACLPDVPFLAAFPAAAAPLLPVQAMMLLQQMHPNRPERFGCCSSGRMLTKESSEQGAAAHVGPA